jgi:hypothetical protein
VLTESDLPVLRIANVDQYAPVHYYEKSFITNRLIEQYEQRLFQ